MSGEERRTNWRRGKEEGYELEEKNGAKAKCMKDNRKEKNGP